MDLIQFLVLFLILFTVDMLRSRYPKLWRKIETPYLVALSAGGAVLVGIFLYAGVRMLRWPQTSLGVKLLYELLMLALCAAVVWLGVSYWKRWKKDRQGGSEK